MQNPAPVPPPMPSAPAQAPSAPGPTAAVTTEGGRTITIPIADAGRPMTARDIRALRIRRENLSDQLQSAQGRRRDVANALRSADPAARAGLEQRLAVLDDRIVQLEGDIAETGRQLTSAPAGLAAAGEEWPVNDGFGGRFDPTFFGGALSGILVVSVAVWTRRLFRGPRRARGIENAATAAQVARLEQAIDAIAVEVERISEAQRFTTKLMAQGRERALAEPVGREGPRDFRDE